MQRNPEYQFVSTDTEPIIAYLVAVWEKMNGHTLAPASTDMLFVRYIANIIIQERVLNNHSANQNVPSRASGDNLDALGDLFRSPERPDAQPSVCTERFHISAAQPTSILIPAGTRVTIASGTIIWETTEDAYIAIGEQYADVSVRCQTAGISGNGYESGQINRLVDVDNIAYYASCENITASDAGADRASDEEYYNLLRESQDAYSTAGSVGGYISNVKSVSTEIADVVVTSPSGGVAVIYTLMKDGTPAGEEIKDEIIAACSEYDTRPLTDHVIAGDPETVTYDIDLTYYIASNSQKGSAAIEADVQAAVADYVAWQSARLGRDINPDELRHRVKETGVKRIVLRNPEYTALLDGSGDPPTVPQIAMVGSINILNGGHEDE